MQEQIWDRMVETAGRMERAQMIEALTLIGASRADRETNVARAAILTAYERRWGGDEVDRLMDALGL